MYILEYFILRKFLKILGDCVKMEYMRKLLSTDNILKFPFYIHLEYK